MSLYSILGIVLNIQLTLEQHGFELHECIYMQIKKILLLFFTCGWKSADVEGQLYVLIHAILYRRLEHQWILVFIAGGVLEPIICGYQATT